MDGPDKFGGNFLLATDRHLGRIAQPLGTRQQSWQAHGHIDPAVIVLTTQQQQAAFESELLDTACERQIEQFRKLGWDLPGVRIDRVLSGQDQVERALALECGGQRPSGGKRIAPGKGGIGQQDPLGVDVSVAAPCDALSKNSFRRGWTKGHQRDRAPGCSLGQFHRLTHGPPAERAHLQIAAVPHDATVGTQLHRLGHRGLFHNRCDTQRPRLSFHASHVALVRHISSNDSLTRVSVIRFALSSQRAIPQHSARRAREAHMDAKRALLDGLAPAPGSMSRSIPRRPRCAH